MAKAVNPKPDLTALAEAVASRLDADVFLYNGRLSRGNVRTVERRVLARKRRKNVVLMLVTHGGDPDAAYILARLLQENYEHFYGFVTGLCKSAGTIVMQGAHELVFAPQGELGPLDIQVARSDDLDAMDSGLTATTALQVLQQESFRLFESTFMEIKERSQGRISFKMATEIAANLTVGLFSPIYAQIQAMHVGEVGRANSIAAMYGERLSEHGKNLKPGAVYELTFAYPSHSFVIDGKEAKQYFNLIREPENDEVVLAAALDVYALDQQKQLYASYLHPEPGVPSTGKGGTTNGATSATNGTLKPVKRKTSRAAGTAARSRAAQGVLTNGATRNGRR